MDVNVRSLLAYATLVFFVLYFLASGISYRATSIFDDLTTTNKFPDFGKYTPFTTLSVEEFPTDDAKRRVILVGDIHGMNTSLHRLLDKISFKPELDTLIHVGDIVAKGTHEGSMAVLSYMASNNITGVRGNHDQKVIEWRSWIDWIARTPEGKRWLDTIHDRWSKEVEGAGADLDAWRDQIAREDRRWWKKIPEGWQLLGDHYKIAREMSLAEYQYLLALPLTLHVPSAHVYVAHAGLLASNPKYKPGNHKQPLSHIPSLPKNMRYKDGNASLPLLRLLQEQALLSDIPQNRDPWVVLNMRGVLKNTQVTRGKDGKPWSEYWNRDMKMCDGFPTKTHVAAKDTLPCYPSTVIYGHAASRGLDIKRWTIGLDTGCVYNKQLTALVLTSKRKRTPDSDDVKRSKQGSSVLFGDNGTGRIVSVDCH